MTNSQEFIETNPTNRWNLIQMAKMIREIYDVKGNYFPIIDILNREKTSLGYNQ